MRFVIAVAVLACLAGLWLLLAGGFDGALGFVDLNRLDPLLVVLLRAGAALLAVIPTSPIAVAAGATQGFLAGVIYVLVGAGLGACAAFLVGRHYGRSFVEQKRWLEPFAASRYGKWLLEGERSQARLMAAVFYCRLLPGLNLDGLSYVAGATPLALWRFLLATLGGILPYTIIAVAIGRALVTLGPIELFALLALLVAAGGLPFGFKLLRRAKR